MQKIPKLAGTCHCGAVTVAIPYRPRRMTSCNCSICRRYGTLWAYFPAVKVKVSPSRGATETYSWGKQHIDFVRCAICGCVVCWKATARALKKERMGVNMRNFDPALIEGVRVRRLDGAKTWKFLD